MMTADEMARVWPEKYPRPDEDCTRFNGAMVRKFGRDFEYRDPASITREEARDWALSNLSTARFVRAMFNDFVRDGLLEENVFARQKLPIPPEKPVVVPKIEEINALAAAARESGQFSLASRIQFSAHTGLRFGEQRAVLRPGAEGLGNVFTDDGNRLQVDWQMSSRKDKLKRPKTAHSIRPVLVPPQAREAVVLALGEHDNKSAFLWPGLGRTLTDDWSKLRREVGIWFKWHALRHYCATWLLNEGATVDDVAKQLGTHAEEIRTRYGHPDTEKALGRLEALVDRTGGES